MELDRLNKVSKKANGISSIIEVQDEYKNFVEILKEFPLVTAIIDSEKKLVYSNNSILKQLNVNSFEEILGLKEGDKISCEYPDNNPEICNTLEQCKFCNVIHAVSGCLINNIEIEEECIIKTGENVTDYDCYYILKVSPYKIDNKQYLIIALNNVSREKKIADLESIFYHDIINSAGNLLGIIDLLKEIDDIDKHKEFIELAHATSQELIDNFMAQKQLLSAENKKLEVEYEMVITDVLFSELLMEVSNHPVAKNHILKISENSMHVSFSTDPRILKRVLLNMLKNALEASPEWGEVEIGSNFADGYVHIWVSNKMYIPPDVQQRIFKHPVSTKGRNRGLGTYSMRLLTEEYLKGKIFFKTNETEGTIFTVMIPYQ